MYCILNLNCYSLPKKLCYKLITLLIILRMNNLNNNLFIVLNYIILFRF